MSYICSIKKLKAFKLLFATAVLSASLAAAEQLEISTIAGNGDADFADGIGKAAKFWNPHGITCDNTTGKLYVADTNNQRIRQFVYDHQKQTWEVSTIAGDGTYGFADGTTGEDAKFYNPHGYSL